MTQLSNTNSRPAVFAPGAAQLIQVGRMMPKLEAALGEEFTVVRLPADDRKDFFATEAAGIPIAVTAGESGLNGEEIRALPALRAIVNFGAGYDAIDARVAAERGVMVSNTPDVLTDCVADMTIGLLIDLLRNLSSADRFVRRGGWETRSFPLAARVSGKRVGIVGLGRIGRAIAHRLEAFNITVSYHNRRPVSDVPFTYYDKPEALAAANDVIIVAATGGPESAGLISRDVLAALGPQGYLINIARGSVIDEIALVEALASGGIAGAGMDVFAHEPHVPAELKDMDNVVLLPHIGSGTRETRDAMAELVLANIRQFITDGTLLTRVLGVSRGDDVGVTPCDDGF